MEQELLNKQMQTLAEKAFRSGCYTFSPFLSPDEQGWFLRSAARCIPVRWQMFGGAEGCERQVIRFGSSEELGYEEDYPICCLEICPRSQQFADPLCHRDFLGALLNLGVVRGVLGDIIIRENVGYVFALQHMANFLQENLQQVKHTAVFCRPARQLPEGALLKLEPRQLLVASPRIDGVIAHLYRLSRSQTGELFRRGLVFRNGFTCSNEGQQLNPGDVVSVRGHGKFRYQGRQGESRKGKCYLLVECYV